LDDLIRLVDVLDALSVDPPLAIATVVNTRGSAYRRPGARMIVRQSMSVLGAVSAGCLERDIIAHCEGLVDTDKPLLLTYDGNSSDELIFGLKLGCDGIVQVLVEPSGYRADSRADIAHSCCDKLRRLRQLLPQLLSVHRRVIAVTVFDLTCLSANPLSTGLVMIKSSLQTIELAPLPQQVLALLAREAQQALEDNRGAKSFVLEQQVGDYQLSALFEVVEPVMSLLVFGSGQDVDPLIEMADVLGWRVTVVGESRSTSTVSKASGGTGELVHIGPKAGGLVLDRFQRFKNVQVKHIRIEQLPALIAGQYFSAAVVMTHDYDRDKKILQSLFQSDLAYIGVVGPRRRADKLLAEMALAGVPITGAELSRLFSPIGLDLGAERPEEIALSILAEIKAVLAGHPGGKLKEKQGPIHQPTTQKHSAIEDLAVWGASLTSAIEKHEINATCALSDD
jgi:xanthine dehydrogenase accessory factor